MTDLILFGTGNAAATHYYNTCFAIRSTDGLLMVDAGGGNQIFTQMEKTGVQLADVHHLFLTHAHTDHVLGAVWLVRFIMQAIQKGNYEGDLHVYGNEKVIGVLDWICHNTLPRKITALISDRVHFQIVTDGESVHIGNWELNAFDILSTKEPQFGFRLTLTSGKTIACLGDEPYNAHCRQWVEGVDWMLAEAFCLYSDADRFRPYEKHHSTALDAARLAAELGVKNLVLYHTEDKTANRKQTYTAEAQSAFGGGVFVPDDLETIRIE